jgi:hypothetical protein
VLDHGGGSRVHRQVDVVRLREQVAHGADLQPARPDEREVPGPRLRDRLVEDPRGIVERLVYRDGVFREGRPDQVLDALVERRLLGSEPVERPPRLRDELRRVLQRLLARRVEAQRSFGSGHLLMGGRLLRYS